MRETTNRADDARLAAISPAQAARFRSVFESARYTQEFIADSMGGVEVRSRGGRNMPRLLRLTGTGSPLHTLYRLFMLGVPVSIKDARLAMAPVPVEEWIEGGLVESSSDSVRGLVTLLPFDGLLLAMDPPELLECGTPSDFVSGVTNSSASLLTFAVRRPCRRALDLGTGSGFLAFLAARHCEKVWATDINPRAIRFAKFNAALNAISNVEFHCGSGFEPVAGQKFDLILTNPPCVIGPNSRYAFRDSGMELDGFCHRLVSDAPGFLEEGGIFQCTLEWPNLPKEDWKERIGAWFQDSQCDALVLRIRTKAVLDHADETVCETDVLDQDTWEELFNEHVDYFEERGIESISEGLIAIRRRSGRGPNWVRFEDLPAHGLEPFGDAVLAAFEARDRLDNLSDDALLKHRLLVAPNSRFESGYSWSGTAWESAAYTLRQNTGFRFQAAIDPHVAGVIRRCDGTIPLQQMLDEMAKGLGIDPAKVIPGCLGVVRGMIERGFLLLEKTPC